MLTPEQIDALRDKFEAMADPVNEYLIKDIVRRIMEAGQATRTSYYKAKIALMLGVSFKDVTDYIDKLYASQTADFRDTFKQAAEVAWNADTQAAGAALSFEKNAALQQIVSAAVALADDEFKNITQTLGMVDPYGQPLPLHEAYISCVDFAYSKVATGAQDYNSAIRDATKNLVAYGVRVIDYESGTHTELGAAIRRDIMGGLGLMVEKVETEAAHAIGTDGWEISAHENSAEDHEPYQGRQFTNYEFERLNGTAEKPGILKRRISTLNCKHIAFPVMLGVQPPMYSPEELEAMKKRNAKGITYEGRHYTGYQATQEQRRIERAIRAQRRKILTLEEIGDQSGLKTARARYRILRDRYKDFSTAAGIKTWDERIEVMDWGPKQEKAM